MLPLNGKTILITGAARRIGRHLAISVAKAGANVIIHHAHSPAEAQEVANEVIKLGRKAWVLECNFNNLSIIPEFIRSAFNLSPIDALVNNASIFLPLSMQQTTIEDWQTHININLTAPFLLSQAFAKYKQNRETGRIVNIVDWRALRPGSDHFPYTISRAALVALTQSMAADLAPRITVNGIAFGAILPPSDGGKAEIILQHTPIARLGKLEEVNETLLFLLSGPSYITGEIIHLDGGRHLI